MILRALQAAGVWAQVRSLRVRMAHLIHPTKSTPPGRPKLGNALDAIDDEFHQAYELSRVEAGHDVPVWIVLANELVCFRRGERTSYTHTPRAYQIIKMVSHTPLAIFSALQSQNGSQLEDVLGRRSSLLRWIAESRAQVAAESCLGGATREALQRVLDASHAFLTQHGSTPSADQLQAFTRGLGPVLLRLIAEATALQLQGLHRGVEQALAALSDDERGRLQVVVTGNHQARMRSLPMQYFRLRFREPPNAERRVAYAEGVSTELDALAVVGTRRLDRAPADAFFADPHRMQRDLLGDAARDLLKASPPAPIV